MDPAVYARHYGVQSEANKVTVTRVAGSEIRYRRVVNTFRKDMNSTVNNIRREQKKLRRCMRGYRKKLYGDKKKKPFKFGWIANTSAEDDFDQREIDLSPNIGKLTQLEAMQALDDDMTQTLANGISGMRGNNAPPINALQAQVDAFLKAPNIKVKRKTVENNKSNSTKNHPGRHRRRFVLGSGKIRSSDRTIREVLQGDEVDNYSLLSDSSDEERGPDDKQNHHNVHDIKYPKDSPTELIKSNSVYFKPISMSNGSQSDANDLTSGENVFQTHTSEANGFENSNGLPDQTKDDLSAKSADKDKSMANDHITFPSHKAILPAILPLSHEAGAAGIVQTGEGRKQFKNNENDRNSHKKRDGQINKKDVSFGDIAKLQHGLKTHKLFSLVDQLASKHGLVGDIDKVDGVAQQSRHKPIKKKIFITNPSSGGNLSLTQYSSVFYPMKYGYVHDVNESTQDSQKSPDLALTTKNDATTSSIADSGIESELTPSFSNKISQIDINGTTIYDVPINTKKMNTNISTTDVSGSSPMMSPLLGQDDINIAVQEIQALQRHRGSRYQRQRRRSSMLEASQFIKSLRDKDNDKKENKKMSFSMEMGSFNKRKDSVMSGEDNEMMPDINKVPWSSALSRIKLVHTLADLTHII